MKDKGQLVNKMDDKGLTRFVKRQKAKRRAQRQTARRLTRLESILFKGQSAQDIYVTDGGVKGRDSRGRRFPLKKFSYDMFEYGDPVAVRGKAQSTTPMSVRQKKVKRQANERDRNEALTRAYKPRKRLRTKDSKGGGKRTLAKTGRKGPRRR